ncbi:CBASS oligonucleotide cyclase [Clavibacter michiganensis]|uniref:CBASS oligonucleotide cyclase n=1 Tax=Clavibacter michiganensis TaxID=28447 RepID=UPI002930E3E1|nr:CBASS oligonucleotide cyclase [Clavibacter michiganensis]
MSKVDDAFGRLKSNLEITAAEQTQAASRHALIRDHLRTRWALTDDFLTGSYDRHTKTKKLKDVDIFVVIDPDGPQGQLANGPGRAAVEALADVLSSRWSSVDFDDNVARVSYADEEVASYEVAPAFATNEGFVIPNGSSWMATNPSVHAKLVTAKNADVDTKFIPLVKMIKAINREQGEPISPSFLIEVMALDLIVAPAAAYKQEVSFFLAAAADAIHEDWRDPAGLGEHVNAHMTPSDRDRASVEIRRWQLIAENARRLEDRGEESAAIEEWRKLFGARMTRS